MARRLQAIFTACLVFGLAFTTLCSCSLNPPTAYADESDNFPAIKAEAIVYSNVLPHLIIEFSVPSFSFTDPANGKAYTNADITSVDWLVTGNAGNRNSFIVSTLDKNESLHGATAEDLEILKQYMPDPPSIDYYMCTFNSSNGIDVIKVAKPNASSFEGDESYYKSALWTVGNNLYIEDYYPLEGASGDSRFKPEDYLVYQMMTQNAEIGINAALHMTDGRTIPTDVFTKSQDMLINAGYMNAQTTGNTVANIEQYVTMVPLTFAEGIPNYLSGSTEPDNPDPPNPDNPDTPTPEEPETPDNAAMLDRLDKWLTLGTAQLESQQYTNALLCVGCGLLVAMIMVSGWH